MEPVGYNSMKLPFDDSGRTELKRLLSLKELPLLNGLAIPFPAVTPWGMCIFSRGAINGCDTYQKDILPVGGSLHWRNNDLTDVFLHSVTHAVNRMSSPNGSQTHPMPVHRASAISGWLKRMKESDLPGPRCRTGDLYSENTTDERGDNKTAH